MAYGHSGSLGRPLHDCLQVSGRQRRGLQRSLMMRLTPSELDRLTIFTAAELARRRRAKGWKLTYPEALALICDEMHEAARGGASYEDVLHVGQSTLRADDVLEGVAELI